MSSSTIEMPYDKENSRSSDGGGGTLEQLPQQKQDQHNKHPNHHRQEHKQRHFQHSQTGERKQSPILNTMMRERRAANTFNENYVTDAQNDGK